jgi:hypothetical protein
MRLAVAGGGNWQEDQLTFAGFNRCSRIGARLAAPESGGDPEAANVIEERLHLGAINGAS